MGKIPWVCWFVFLFLIEGGLLEIWYVIEVLSWASGPSKINSTAVSRGGDGWINQERNIGCGCAGLALHTPQHGTDGCSYCRLALASEVSISDLPGVPAEQGARCRHDWVYRKAQPLLKELCATLRGEGRLDSPSPCWESPGYGGVHPQSQWDPHAVGPCVCWENRACTDCVTAGERVFYHPYWRGSMEPNEQKLLLKPPWSCLRGQPMAFDGGGLQTAVRAHEKLKVDVAGAIERKTHAQRA